MDLRFGETVMLPGLFSTTRSAVLSTPRGALDTLTGGQGFYGPPLIVMVTLLVGWFAATVLRARSAVREPLWRACLFGSMLSVALFALTAPYAEVRFVYPALALLFACAARAMSRLRAPGDVVGAAALLAIVLASTVRDSSDKQHFAVVGLSAAAVVTAIVCFTPARHAKRVRATAAAMILLVLSGLAYVNWAAYFRDYSAGRTDVWPAVHGDVAKGWAVVDREAPPGSVVAYANVHFVYPLQGTLLKNRVVYVPSKPDVRAMHDLPRSASPLAGEQIPAHFTGQLQAESDARTWRANLTKSGADFLFVGKTGPKPPPELALAEKAPEAFERLHEDDKSAVFRVRDHGVLAD